ncbi:MAG: pyridoxamine 5'-phosphate oxidase family protein [Candidatus Binatia bacterium]|nr:pyridoxamine 5'-phosphate oxidase family protein [Candidatus Binatia bacterium]
MSTNRRGAIEMTDEERQAFLGQGKTIYLASNGEDGYPHLIAMWYAIDGDAVVMSTYRKSQKVRNLLRDPRCTLLLEEGPTYAELTGLFLRGRCEVIDDEATTLETLRKVGTRAGGSTPAGTKAEDSLRKRAKKRVTLVFRAEKTRSWDHRKLGGTY